MAGKDLIEFVDLQHTHCLNEKAKQPWANALKSGYREDAGLTLESDADEQLLLNIHFNQKVHIKAITIHGPEDSGPRIVKLFVNKPSMGFSDADGTAAAQELVLTKEQLKGDPIPLKFVKFQSVNVLSLFVESNQEDEESTKVQKVVLYGSSGDTFNVAEIKKVEEK